MTTLITCILCLICFFLGHHVGVKNTAESEIIKVLNKCEFESDSGTYSVLDGKVIKVK